jgi:hypothetical protein
LYFIFPYGGAKLRNCFRESPNKLQILKRSDAPSNDDLADRSGYSKHNISELLSRNSREMAFFMVKGETDNFDSFSGKLYHFLNDVDFSVDGSTMSENLVVFVNG